MARWTVRHIVIVICWAMLSCGPRCALAQSDSTSVNLSSPVIAPVTHDQAAPVSEPEEAFSNGFSQPLETESLPWIENYELPNSFQILPQGLIYRSYLGGPREPRMGTTITRISGDTTLWDGTLGARVGIFRYGNSDPIRPCGFQMDVEGAALVRLDLEEEVDVRSTDYRVGVPFTWGDQFQQWKFAYYHVSSHLGDEFLLKNPDFPILFQARDTLLLGYSRYVTDRLRLYGEVGWAFYSIASDPWEFQFGLDFVPRERTGLRGAPFFAINGSLRQELDFGGGLNVEGGWAWRSDVTAHLFRIGLQYYNGASSQYAFLPYHEEQFGFGLWYDF